MVWVGNQAKGDESEKAGYPTIAFFREFVTEGRFWGSFA
jgi:hypothetical protein